MLEQVFKTSDEQFPIAVTLGCIDSRPSCELVFDQGIGHIFSIRIAESVINDDILGCMEFACNIAGSKLIVVLGHTKCGAIQAACDNVEKGNLSTLLNKIQPSLYYEKSVTENQTAENSEFIEKIVEESLILRKMTGNRKIGFIGTIYEVDTGRVEFLEKTFMFGEIKHFYMVVT